MLAHYLLCLANSSFGVSLIISYSNYIYHFFSSFVPFILFSFLTYHFFSSCVISSVTYLLLSSCCLSSQVRIEDRPVRFFVHKRPHVDFFLAMVSWFQLKHTLECFRLVCVCGDGFIFFQISQWYELVIFTASMEASGSVENGGVCPLNVVWFLF